MYATCEAKFKNFDKSVFNILFFIVTEYLTVRYYSLRKNIYRPSLFYIIPSAHTVDWEYLLTGYK